MVEKKKIVRLAVKITEAIIGILKDEFGEKNEGRQRKIKKVRENSRSASVRDTDNSNS